MKNLLSLLFIALPLCFAFTSCSDDDDLPNVSLSISVKDGHLYNDTIYVVQGDTIYVDAINIRNNESGKVAIVTQAQYNFAGELFTTAIAPYGWARPTSADENSIFYIPTGKYPLAIFCDIAAEDKSLAIAAMSYVVKIVPTPEDIPSTAVPGDTDFDNTYIKDK